MWQGLPWIKTVLTISERWVVSNHEFASTTRLMCLFDLHMLLIAPLQWICPLFVKTPGLCLNTSTARDLDKQHVVLMWDVKNYHGLSLIRDFLLDNIIFLYKSWLELWQTLSFTVIFYINTPKNGSLTRILGFAILKAIQCIHCYSVFALKKICLYHTHQLPGTSNISVTKLNVVSITVSNGTEGIHPRYVLKGQQRLKETDDNFPAPSIRLISSLEYIGCLFTCSVFPFVLCNPEYMLNSEQTHNFSIFIFFF